MNRSRSKAALVNSSVATISQVVLIFAQFISRTVFVKTLGEQYLGLNGLFTNLLSVLNLAELGIASAITYSLFKPLIENNKGQVSAIMSLLKRWYRFIALAVVAGGVVLMPFIPYLIHNSTFSNIQIYTLFTLALAGTVSTYLLSYKRTLLVADQYGYINTLNTVGFSIGQQIIQIIFLIIYPNFYIFLSIQLLSNLVSNYNISKVVDKRYPYLSKYNEPVNRPILEYFKKNVIGMVSAKLGGIVVNGTDNLVISAFLGLASVGRYANYTLITTGLNSVLTQAVSAVSASIGNLAVDKHSKNELKVFYMYFNLTVLLSLIMSVGISCFSTSFINIWIGGGFVLNWLIVFLIAVNFFIQAIRQALITYSNSYGLYWQQRYKPIAESIVNLVISILLISKTNLGISGVLIGTISSNIFVNIWWEPLVVFKYGLRKSMIKFLFYYLSIILVGIGCIGGFQYYGYRITSLKFSIIYTTISIIISIFIILGLFKFLEKVFNIKNIVKNK